MFESLIPILERFEGRVSHMYLDSLGYVTVGVGHRLATVGVAYGLPFLLPNGMPAEQHDIYNDYYAIRQSHAARLLAYYAHIADLRLTDEAVDKLLLADIEVAFTGVQQHISGAADFPEPAQNALVNMAFQLGVFGLSRYRNLIAACLAHNWQRAAEECYIHGAQDARNEANKNFFLAV